MSHSPLRRVVILSALFFLPPCWGHESADHARSTPTP